VRRPCPCEIFHSFVILPEACRDVLIPHDRPVSNHHRQHS
jgi:hypothetical protein